MQATLLLEPNCGVGDYALAIKNSLESRFDPDYEFDVIVIIEWSQMT